VLFGKDQFEVATFRKDGPYSDGRRPDQVEFVGEKEDVFRRDITINGLLYDIKKEKVIDYVNGQQDIEKKIIRTIGNPAHRFAEDKLRLIRAIRFSARFNFEIEGDTLKAISKMSDQIVTVSVERLRDELTKIILGPNVENGLELLKETGLLKYLLPELQACVGVQQPAQFHPEGDVWTHVKMVVGYLKKPNLVQAWVALLHDIGKPKTYKITDRIRFNNHQRVGSIMAKKICRRYKFSKLITEQIVAGVDNHMNFMNVNKMRVTTLKRFLRRETLADEMAVHRADCLGSHGKLDNYKYLKQMQKKYTQEEIKPKPLINGVSLIEMGYSPGPKFKKILKYIEDAQLSGEIETEESAKKLVLKKFKLG